VDYGAVTVANSTAQAFSGKHSLALTLTGAGNPGVMSPSGLTGITTGTVLTYHVYEPASVSLQADLYAVDGNWNYDFSGALKLTPGGWSTLTFKVPTLTGGLRYIGIEIENGGGAKTTLYLDAIGW
jgi:hypothetical protein